MKRLAETTICGLIRLFSRLIIIALPILPVPYSQGWPIDRREQQRGVGVEPTGQVAVWPASAKRWALVIGVDQYKDKQISSLNGAANDAGLLASALIQRAGFPADQVIVLATDQPEERQPTRVNILRRLSNLSAVVPKDGLLLVSFAGHGIERGDQAFLLPSDAQISNDVSFLEETGLSVTRIRDRIKATGVRQVVILLDACRNDPTGRADSPNNLTEAYVRNLNFDIRNKEIVAFATLYATAVGERAFEFTEKRQGYFTWALVEALKGAASNEKGEITLAGLIKYVQETVPKRVAVDLGGGRNQRPFVQMDGYKADELVIAVAGPVSTSVNSTPATPATDSAAIELSFWESIKNSKNVSDFNAYLEQYPNGHFAILAKNRVNEINSSVDVASSMRPPVSTTAEGAKNDALTVKTFEVEHLYHGGDGLLYVSPNKIEFKESGKRAHEDDNFSVTCAELREARGHSFGQNAAVFHISLANKNYAFFPAKDGHAYPDKSLAESIVAAVNAACGRH